MEIVVARRILEEAGIDRDEFAGMVGVKPSSMRIIFWNGRFSKKAIAKLEELSGEIRQRADLIEVDELIEEIKEVETLGDERLGTVYMVPRNPYWRMVEFSDGTHGRFRAQAGRFLLGAQVKVRKLPGNEWGLIGEYDRKDRLCG